MNAPPLCVIYLTVYMENANSIGKMQTLERMPPPVVLSSPPRLRFIFYFNPPPTPCKPRTTRATEDSRLSVNYLTLLYVIDSYSLIKVSVNILTLRLHCTVLLGLWAVVGNRFSIGYDCLRYALPVCTGLKVWAVWAVWALPTRSLEIRRIL